MNNTHAAYRIRLELLDTHHASALYHHGTTAEVWRYLQTLPFQSLFDARTWIKQARTEYARGTRIPYAVVNVGSGEAIGSSSFMSLRKEHKSVEIGWTWLGTTHQGKGINTQCKYLMLEHAFDVMQANRVEIKTDERNLRSQATLERIGAVREGVLRAHMIMPDGFVRNTVYYSITREEWPTVQARMRDTKTHSTQPRINAEGSFASAA